MSGDGRREKKLLSSFELELEVVVSPCVGLGIKPVSSATGGALTTGQSLQPLLEAAVMHNLTWFFLSLIVYISLHGHATMFFSLFGKTFTQ